MDDGDDGTWDALAEDERKVVTDCETETRVVSDRGRETLEGWRKIGEFAKEIQRFAMIHAGTNRPVGRRFTQIWRLIADHAPTFRDMDKAARSHAMWLSENWVEVHEWWSALPQNEQARLQHPASVHRRFEAGKRDKPVWPRANYKAEAAQLRAYYKKAGRFSAQGHSQNPYRGNRQTQRSGVHAGGALGIGHGHLTP